MDVIASTPEGKLLRDMRNGILLLPSADYSVQAEPSGAPEGYVKEKETKKYRRLALVDNRPEALYGMHLEITVRHLTACNKCDIPHSESQRDKKSTEKFDDSGCNQQRVGNRPSAPQNAKELLGPVAREKQSANDAKNSEKKLRVLSEPMIHRTPPLSASPPG